MILICQSQIYSALKRNAVWYLLAIIEIERKAKPKICAIYYDRSESLNHADFTVNLIEGPNTVFLEFKLIATIKK